MGGPPVDSCPRNRRRMTRPEPQRSPPAATAAVLPVAEREQAQRDEEERQEEDVSAREREDDQRDGYADGEGAQQLPFLPWLGGGAGDDDSRPSPAHAPGLLVAPACLVGVTRARQVVAR
jgi:hypothetical protein